MNEVKQSPRHSHPISDMFHNDSPEKANSFIVESVEFLNENLSKRIQELQSVIEDSEKRIRELCELKLNISPK